RGRDVDDRTASGIAAAGGPLLVAVNGGARRATLRMAVAVLCGSANADAVPLRQGRQAAVQAAAGGQRRPAARDRRRERSPGDEGGSNMNAIEAKTSQSYWRRIGGLWVMFGFFGLVIMAMAKKPAMGIFGLLVVLAPAWLLYRRRVTW